MTALASGGMVGSKRPAWAGISPISMARRRARSISAANSGSRRSSFAIATLSVGANGDEFGREHSGQQVVEANGDLLGEPDLPTGRALTDRYVGDDRYSPVAGFDVWAPTGAPIAVAADFAPHQRLLLR